MLSKQQQQKTNGSTQYLPWTVFTPQAFVYLKPQKLELETLAAPTSIG